MMTTAISKRFSLFIFLFSIHSFRADAQEQFGVAGNLIMMHPLEVTTAVAYGNPYDNAANANAYAGGFSIEVMKTKLGINRFRPSYFGLGFSCFPQSKSSFVGYASDGTNNLPVTFNGTRNQSQWDVIAKIGFEIRQPWSDFLFINIGIGGGISHGTVKYELEGYDPQKYYLIGTKDGTLQEKGFGVISDEFISVFYELPNFYLLFQTHLMANYCETANEGFSIRTNFGIYYVLNKNE